MLACQKGCPDVALLHSTRTRKVLRSSGLLFLKDLTNSLVGDSQTEVDMALNPVAPSKVQVFSQAFYTRPFYNFERKSLESPQNRSDVLHFCLKRFGFHLAGGARRAGKSVIYIWRSNNDAKVKSTQSSQKTLKMELKSKKGLLTSQNELVYYSEFREEVLGMAVHNNRLYYHGVAVYGVIDIYEAICQKAKSQELEFCSKFKAKLCYEKYFSNILTRRVLHFNENLVLVLPFRESSDIFLYNILTDRYSVLRFSNKESSDS